MRWLSIFLACLASRALAQAQPPPSPYAAISGVVLDDAAGTPLRRAVVILSTLDTPPLDAVTFTESNGAFGFTIIPPGKYRLRADQEGFQHASFGASNPNRPPGTLTLAAGDIRYGITFRLRPLANLSGVVTDADGDPLAGAQIRLLRSGFARRRPKYQDAGWAVTDDRGGYRLEDVAAGQYLVMATESNQTAALIQPEVAAGQAAPQKMYAPEFYPDANKLSAAAPVALTPGKDLDGIDFQLIPRPAATLRGKVLAPDDVPENSAVQISVYPQDVLDTHEQAGGAVAVAPALTFELSNLLPGSYVVVATLSTPNRDYRGVQRIELSSGGEDLAIPLERAIDLTGRVDLEGNQPPAGPFHLTLFSGDFPRVQSEPQAEAKPDGSFVIPNVVPGIWDIGVQPIPRGGYLKAMRLGDEDVLTADMVITPDTHAPLRVVVSTRGAVVKGTVTVPPGLKRSARAQVLLAPSGKYEYVLSFYDVQPADEAGHFEFKGVTPGRYKLYAFEELEPPSYEDPNFLKPFEKLSEAFDVPEGGHVSQDVPLIPVNAQPAAEN